MFDELHFEGPLARYTLRRWTTHVRGASPRTERVRHHDEHEALTGLRSVIDTETLRRLSAFVHAADLAPASPGHDSLELLWLVARKLVSGELVLERERIEPMASEVAERSVVLRPTPLVNEIVDGAGLHATSLVDAQQATLGPQAKQAAALRAAAREGSAFCEVCAGAHERRVPDSEQARDQLSTQAKQAQTLRTASASGVSFCEACASCRAPLPLAKPPLDAGPPPEPPRSELNRQAKQAESLVSASDSGKAFCEQCRC